MILVIDPRPEARARLTQLLDQLQLPHKFVQVSEALVELGAKEPPTAMIVAPQLSNLSGDAMIALARSMQPRLECLVVAQPDKDRGLLENLVRRIRKPGAPTSV